MVETTTNQCGCVKGADGRCAACVALVAGLVKDLAGLIMESQRKIEQKIAEAGEVCGPCARHDWDRALAGAVLDMAAAGAGDRTQRVSSIVGAVLRLVETGKRQGVQAYPLTEGAIAEVARALQAASPSG